MSSTPSSRNPTPRRPSPPLAKALRAASGAVQAVLTGTPLTEALEHVPATLRPAAQDLAFHTMRRLGRARALLRLLVPRRPSNTLVEAHLLVAISLLDVRPEDKHAPRYAAHTVVDQTVAALGQNRRLQSFKSLANASLRRYLREHEQLMTQLGSEPEAHWNYPRWWIQRLRADYPTQWANVLAAGNVPAPMTIRVNRRRMLRNEYQSLLEGMGVHATPVGSDGLVLAHALPVTALAGFDAGWCSVQVAGAQFAAPLLQLQDGMRVLDACAAPGGKTAHMLELANVDCLALDNNEHRLSRINNTLQRLGLKAQLEVGDAARPQDWWDGRPFDAVLADVPCSASGIVRRHPDIRWLRQPAHVDRVVSLQKAILDALWQVVAPGGKLLYVTCSVFPAEGEHQAQGFMARHPNARRLPAPGQLLPASADAPPHQQHDGFFYALFSKA